MGKSAYHRTENTFKFQGFSERIANINIDIIHQIRRIEDDPEEHGTYFGDALIKWSELNCTEHFTAFRKEISDQVQTFPQLVHHEESIVASLKTHLQVHQSLAFEPLLDLMVQLARDLQVDFYKHFRDVFDVIIAVLNSHPQDTELLEKAFTCLSYLFKFLWRYLLKDIQEVYGYFSALLGKQYKEYVRRFAAESFAFLMRKIKKPEDLFDHMFKSLEHEEDYTQANGVGLLLFEMMKGVKQQFHSCTEKVFPILLLKLGTRARRQDAWPWHQVEQCFFNMFEAMASYTNKECAKDLWQHLLKIIVDTHESWIKSTKKHEASLHLERLLRMMSVWLKYKKGAIVSQPNQVAQTLGILVADQILPDNASCRLLDGISDLLTVCHNHISIQTTAKLVHQVYQSKISHASLYRFTKTVFSLPFFEKDVLPLLLPLCHRSVNADDQKSSTDSLLMLTELLLFKVPPTNDASKLSEYRTYLLDFTGAIKSSSLKHSVPDVILSSLSFKEDQSVFEVDRMSRIWTALICLPHVRPMPDKGQTVKLVQDLIQHLFKESKDASSPDKVLFLLGEAFVSLSIMHQEGDLFEWISLDLIVDILKEHSKSLYILKVADIYFSQASLEDRHDLLSQQTMERVYPYLQDNLSSWKHEVRLLTLRILSQFELPLPVTEMESKSLSVFLICLHAEEIPLGVHEYRGILLHLQKLDFSIIQNSLPIGAYSQVPLRYLIGCLFKNFKLLWEPIMTLIASHGLGMKSKEFWEVYGSYLIFASDLSESELLPIKEEDKKITSSSFGEVEDLFMQHSGCSKKKNEANFSNFRYYMWKAMTGFSERCQPKSRELSPLFLKFMNNEYYPTDQNVAPTQDIRNRPGEITDIQDDAEAADDIPETGDTAKSDAKEEKGKVRRRAATRSLIVHLEVFGKFNDPRSLYQEPKLRDLYDRLLLHRDPQVQTTTFRCIMTYKYKYLTPYRENFERLLDDKTFRNEIVLFSIDEASSLITQDHRKDLLPILFRILFGKMQWKSSGDSSVRKSIMLRFLAGCHQGELHMFMDLLFGPFQQFISDNPYETVSAIRRNVDPSSVVPMRRMQGVLSTIDMLFKKLGHLMDSYLPSLFQILLGVSATCAVYLDQREKISPPAVRSLKNIRQIVVARITQFFSDFDQYQFSDNEIDAVFEVAVWPQLPGLHYEGIYHPTQLLRLIHQWSQNARFLPLLAKHHENDKELTPLVCVFRLLVSNTDVNIQVTSLIMEIVDNLLQANDLEADNDEIMLNVNNSLLDNGSDFGEIGIFLLRPHIPIILTFIQSKIVPLLQLMRKQGTCKELNILARISGYVHDESVSADLISLLLPFLSTNNARNQELELDVMQCILNLLDALSDPLTLFRPLCKLYSTIQQRKGRILLCSIMEKVSSADSGLQATAQLITKMNAWDKRRMDEPDYGVRLDAFRSMNKLISDMATISVDCLLPVIHNCCHFIVTVDDLSLRDCSTHCLVTMVTHLAKCHCERDIFRQLISQTLLVAVKLGLRHKSETVRHEFITILMTLVRAYPQEAMFADLSSLTDADLEADFFENIKHIQTHRRARALRKMIKYVSQRSLNPGTVLAYLLPLASSFILDEAYLKVPALQEAAVDAVGALCRLLSWQHYFQQLRHYLQKLMKNLEQQKLIVRVVVAILNGFHFDLSLSQHNATSSKITPAQTEEEVTPTDPAEDVDIGDPVEDESTELTVNDSPMTPEELPEEADNSQAKTTRCLPTLATRIHTSILQRILPQLHKCLIQKERNDEEHKLAKSKYAEDIEILRVPIALAMVKLLQHLPTGSMKHTLSGILIRVCNFLKSRSQVIRETARDTLVKITISLGPKFLPAIVYEMRNTLKRGYQLHVLSYSVYMLLKNLAALMKPGDLDACLKSLIQIFNEEIFGTVAEEKDVAGIVGKLIEAKSSKSYDSYQIVAKFVSRNELTALILDLKKLLDNTHSHKISKKVQDVLKRVVTGLMDNEAVTTEAMMVFIHGLISETLPALSNSKQNKTEGGKKKTSIYPPSCLLLTGAPPRGGIKSKTSKKTNIHVMAEFGLQLLVMSLKRSRLDPAKEEHLQLLDPFIAILSDCLQSKHIKINSWTLRCLCWLLKMPLPSITDHISRLANGMFLLLKNYASAGAAKGDNLELVSTAFKAVTVLVRDVKLYIVQADQVQVLLTFCEEDIHDHTRQGTAFTLIKAILSRKLVIPEMMDMISKIEAMSITADSAHVRLQCRQIVLQFLLDYPLGDKLLHHIEFYLTHLSYEHELGRESALEMLATIFSTFPQKILLEQAAFFFVPMAAALANDESPKCRKLTALAIKSLMEKIDHNTRNQLFAIIEKWFSDKRVKHRSLAAQLAGLLVEAESVKFESHLDRILPLLETQLEPGKYKKECEHISEEQSLDRLLYNALNLLVKILRECNIIRNSSWTNHMTSIWENIESLLSHPHAWVRLLTAQLFGMLFAVWSPQELLTEGPLGKNEYFSSDGQAKLHHLAMEFCSQLQSPILEQELANQIIKNMVFVAKAAKLLDQNTEKNKSSEILDVAERKTMISVPWLVRKMAREANHEAINNAKATIKRSCVFKWFAAISLDLEAEMLPDVLHLMVPSLQREITDLSNTMDAELKSLAQEVIEVMKSVVGVQTFTEVYSKVLKNRTDRKNSRKRHRAIEAVSNPEIAAKRKIKKHLAKKETKKRRIQELRPTKTVKRKKLS